MGKWGRGTSDMGVWGETTPEQFWIQGWGLRAVLGARNVVSGKTLPRDWVGMWGSFWGFPWGCGTCERGMGGR